MIKPSAMPAFDAVQFRCYRDGRWAAHCVADLAWVSLEDLAPLAYEVRDIITAGLNRSEAWHSRADGKGWLRIVRDVFDDPPPPVRAAAGP